MIDHLASAVTLARSVKMGLDRSRIVTEINTAQLELLLNALIDAGTPQHARDLDDAAGKAIAEHVALLDTEAKWAAEDNERARV